MLLVIIIIIILIITIVRKYRWHGKRIRELVNKFDGPKTYPILGNSHLVMGLSPMEAFLKFRQISSDYPSLRPYRYWNFHVPIIVLRDPDDIKVVAPLPQKSYFYRFLADLSGDGILTSNGEKWRRNRAVIEPALNTSILSDYFLNIFNRHCDQLIQTLRTEEGKTVDLFYTVFRAEIASIYETLTGICDESCEELVRHFEDLSLTDLVAKRGFTPWLQPSLIFKIYLYVTGRGNKYENVKSDIFRTILKKRNSLQEWKLSNKMSYERGQGIIDNLLNMHNLDDESIANESITLLLAGTETSGLAVCFTLLMLAMNQNIQQKVWQELYEVFGDSHHAPTVENLTKLPFLEQCIKESLRMFSIIPNNYRYVSQDVVLKDGRIIPAGSHVHIWIYDVHHNSQYYPDPDVWNPHNFDPDKVANRPFHAYLPFGVGPRICVGYKYAMMSLKIFLSSILREFKVTTKETQCPVTVDFIVRSKLGYKVQLTRR